MMIPTLRRYQTATVVEAADGFNVMLDAALLQTPAGQALQLPTRLLAAAVAAEWAAQERAIKPATMPLTQLAMTAQDRPVSAGDLLAWLDGDLIAHYADDAELRAVEAGYWQPLHDWLQERFNARLPLASGIVASRDAVEAGSLPGYLRALDPYRLLALRELAAAVSSVSLALALMETRLTAAEAVTAAEIDSLQQMRRWGEDPDILRRHAALQAELELLLRFIALLG